jgi:hypothetical protein
MQKRTVTLTLFLVNITINCPIYFQGLAPAKCAQTPSGECAPTPSGECAPTPSGECAPTPSGECAPTPSGECAPTPSGKCAPTPSSTVGASSVRPINGVPGANVIKLFTIVSYEFS